MFIHVGLGTVEMNGKGFARFVEMGDVVKAGQPLISFDREAIKAAGHEDIVTVIVSGARSPLRASTMSASLERLSAATCSSSLATRCW